MNHSKLIDTSNSVMSNYLQISSLQVTFLLFSYFTVKPQSDKKF